MLRFISTEGDISTDPGDPYLYYFLESCYAVSILPVLGITTIGIYFNACNAIDNRNRMMKSDPSLEKYWVKQSGYFRLETTMSVDMEITDEKIFSCHGILEHSRERNYN